MYPWLWAGYSHSFLEAQAGAWLVTQTVVTLWPPSSLILLGVQLHLPHPQSSYILALHPRGHMQKAASAMPVPEGPTGRMAVEGRVETSRVPVELRDGAPTWGPILDHSSSDLQQAEQGAWAKLCFSCEQQDSSSTAHLASL